MEQKFRWMVAVKFRWKAVAVGGTVAQKVRWMVADRIGTKFRLKGKFLAEGNVIFLYCQKIFLYCQKIALCCQKKLDKKNSWHFQILLYRYSKNFIWEIKGRNWSNSFGKVWTGKKQHSKNKVWTGLFCLSFCIFQNYRKKTKFWFFVVLKARS